MTATPRIHHQVEYPRSCRVQQAKVKHDNSIPRRVNPDTTMGAEPDLLGSSGTAKVPHITANTTGIPTDSKYLGQLSDCFQPHEPRLNKAESSRRIRRAKFSGCEPKSYPSALIA